MSSHMSYVLSDDLVLMVETARNGRNDEYFAGIWPKEGGPTEKIWIEADSPQESFEKAKIWAKQMQNKESK